MQVYRDIEHLPVFRNAIITIGTFDGVHVGHSQILHQMLEEAHKVEGTAVVITFYPHPRQVIHARDTPLRVLNTPEEKYELLHSKGIEQVVVVPFDTKFAEQQPSVYIEEFLVKKFHPHTIIIGYDHRFGKNREGDYHLLENKGEKMGFRVMEIPEHILENVIISSTRIREALNTGNIEMANEFLGYPYFFTGTVIHGNKLGKTIGFPTANILIDDKDKLVPAFGVYAVRVKVEGSDILFKGMLNIGIRPTVDGTNAVIEVNIFEFDEDIYDRKITITFIRRLRSEIKFSGLEALKEQLGKDRVAALEALK